MDAGKRKWVLVLALGLYGLAVLVSVWALSLKRQALQFHTRDYNYFVEQAARLSDPGLADRFALNIEGYNFLGLQGIEGVKNLVHAIHAEYFRYTYVLLYALFRSPTLLYLFYSLIFFSPLVYFAWLVYRQPGRAWQPALLFAMLYLLFPATLPSVTADLRPRILFAAAWCLVVLAVYYRRPFLEKLLLFLLLLGIREEGVLLGAVVIALNFLWMREAGRWRQTLVLLALDLLALAAFLAFMVWGEYTRVDVLYDPRNLLAAWGRFLPLIVFMAAALVAFTLWVGRRRPQRLRAWLALLVYVAALALTGLPSLRDVARWLAEQPVAPGVWERYVFLVTTPTLALVYYLAILLLALLWDRSGGRVRRGLSAAMAALGMLFLVTTLAVIPAQVASWQQARGPAALVWQFTQAHDPYQTRVLVDYQTYQAFYNYDYVLVYNRLPVWLIAPYKRFYPENRDNLAGLMAQRLQYAVIARSSLADVQALADLAGVHLTEVSGNQEYVVLKLR